MDVLSRSPSSSSSVGRLLVCRGSSLFREEKGFIFMSSERRAESGGAMFKAIAVSKPNGFFTLAGAQFRALLSESSIRNSSSCQCPKTDRYKKFVLKHTLHLRQCTSSFISFSSFLRSSSSSLFLLLLLREESPKLRPGQSEKTVGFAHGDGFEHGSSALRAALR